MAAHVLHKTYLEALQEMKESPQELWSSTREPLRAMTVYDEHQTASFAMS
jgi:hypothetical protein